MTANEAMTVAINDILARDGLGLTRHLLTTQCDVNEAVEYRGVLIRPIRSLGSIRWKPETARREIDGFSTLLEACVFVDFARRFSE